MKDLEIPKIFSIKKTPKETLENWFRLMTVGRAIDNKAPNYLKQAKEPPTFALNARKDNAKFQFITLV